MRAISEVLRIVKREPGPEDIASWQQAKDHLEQSGARHHLIRQAQLLIGNGDPTVAVYETTPRRKLRTHAIELRWSMGEIYLEDDLEVDDESLSYWVSKGVQIESTDSGLLTVKFLGNTIWKVFPPQKVEYPLPLSLEEKIAHAVAYADNNFDMGYDFRYGRGSQSLERIVKPIPGLTKIL